MDYPETLREQVKVVIRGLDALAALHTATRFPILEPSTYSCDFAGRRYWRVVQHMSNGQDMVEFFVDNQTGDVLKGSWKAPESKVARFNIATPEGRARLFEHKRLNQHGYLYFDRIKAADALMGQ